MPDNQNGPIDPHLQNALFGTPELHPDEQRRYLGTFRERVEIGITVAQIQHRDYVQVLHELLRDNPDEVMYLNGNLDQETIGKYIKLANDLNIKFTIKTEDIHSTAPDRFALIIAAKSAINREVIDVEKRSPETKPTSASQGKPSFFKRFFK